MPKITYSGSQAAFSFDGIQVGQGQTVKVSAADLTRISKGKAFKSLVEKGELEVQEIAEDEPKTAGKTGGRGGKGGKQNDAAGEQQKPTDEDALAAVKAELTALEVTFSDDETLEQLQAKLAQAKE
ncbi:MULTISPECIES: hypothetical protein [Acinetobacter calcoaceticus/baumannii complex]|uniref:hypothetical protein n=1 Tax=Acinetobacter calcoaceticus/baumannii complex TaxID=909768 RepID=UPI0010221FBF|nr:MULTISPECIES: hypothetical protein [Acinetobacter calcoaceticus/baumannii complex]MCZ3182454.1 hypothetical protein [Acinetobacter baumannii]MDB9693305.1 hypothetical protein [Acinetobacter nosocomialis]RYL13093.1 hypothetical protein EWO92_20145 [Acinetobacter baumannii]RYL25403.1 hypothetical protein EWO96_20125 [Acinetobacter baumannii]RYL41446.1 hypothetical protein EWP49_19910 [Acinetobacter baumannii]